MDISVVIPIYGCKAALKELYDRVTNVVSNISSEYEIVLVDDNCPQGSWEIIEQICKDDKKVKGLHMSRNFGQMKAITAGLDYCSGDWVVVMDCDLQDSPEDIEKLYRKAQEGYDVVFSRREDRHDNKFKIMISKIFYKIYSWLSDDCYDPAMSNYCICHRKVIDNFCLMREYHRAFTMYLKWLGFKSAVIDVEHNNRKEGKSSYTTAKRIGLAMDILLSQSDKILKFIVILGLCVSVISLVLAVWLIIRYMILDILAGWTSIIVAICLMTGLLMLSIGCVGLYVGKIFMQTKNRPLYVVRDVLN